MDFGDKATIWCFFFFFWDKTYESKSNSRVKSLFFILLVCKIGISSRNLFRGPELF